MPMLNLHLDTAELEMLQLFNVKAFRNLNKIREILPAASFRIYAFSALANWLEFSMAMQTFFMCGGISSKIPGSHSGGGPFISLLQLTIDNVARTRSSIVENILADIICKKKKQIHFIKSKIDCCMI